MSVQNKTRQLPGAAPVIKAQEKDANVGYRAPRQLAFWAYGSIKHHFSLFHCPPKPLAIHTRWMCTMTCYALHRKNVLTGTAQLAMHKLLLNWMWWWGVEPALYSISCKSC